MWGKKVVQSHAEIPRFWDVHYAGQFLCGGFDGISISVWEDDQFNNALA